MPNTPLNQSQTTVAQPAQKKGRPVLITILSILAFIGLPLSALLVLLPTFPHTIQYLMYGKYYLPIMLVSNIAIFSGFVGLWQMKKWGFIVYACAIAYNILMMFIFGAQPSISQAVIQLVCLGLVGCYFRRFE